MKNTSVDQIIRSLYSVLKDVGGWKLYTDQQYNLSVESNQKYGVQTTKCGDQNGKMRSPAFGIITVFLHLKWWLTHSFKNWQLRVMLKYEIIDVFCKKKIVPLRLKNVVSFWRTSSQTHYWGFIPEPHWGLPSPDPFFCKVQKTLNHTRPVHRPVGMAFIWRRWWADVKWLHHSEGQWLSYLVKLKRFNS